MLMDSATVTPPRRARIIFWEDGFCDFAFGFAQNDSVGGMPVRV